MVETDRPHLCCSNINSSSSTSDLFVCFTSRLSSSSSMRLASKSILSPARSASLSTSLSRRFRSSSSMKSAGRGRGGGVLASPMFGTNSRKRSGSGLENNPEPSSPKVTCIGQVRVKTRKHVKKKLRARSRRKGGETSFRRSADQSDGSGGWVHLPVTICESLRSFGSELSCFFPCRSSCADGDNHRNREGKPQESDGCGGANSCGAAFARWFVAVEETGGKRREIELVVGGEEEEEEDDRRRSRRRHVFDGIDFGEIEVKTEKKEKEETGRVSICVPPKDALLLMRCRSDPVEVAALANRVRETALCQNDDAAEEEDRVEEKEEERRFEMEMEYKKRIELCEKWIFGESVLERGSAEAETNLISQSEIDEVEAGVNQEKSVEEEEVQVLEDLHDEEIEAKFNRKIQDDLRNVLEEEEEYNSLETGDFAYAAAAAASSEGGGGEEEEETVTAALNQERSGPGDLSDTVNPELDPSPVPEERETQQKELEKDTASYQLLPDCLLLMMCEPKLSMEVSKETWVCKTDFVRWFPERPPPLNKTNRVDQPKKLTATTESSTSSRRRSADQPPAANPVLLQPPRSSCSYPAAPPPMVAVDAAAEQKAGGRNKGYEPLVLTRCKSEPRRSSAKLAAPEACFWKNRKLEPLRPATLGVGAAGVGF